MAKTSQNKIGVPFEPLTAQKAKEWYQRKHLTTTGYLLAIKGITRPPGVDLVIPNVLAFCRKWEITKSAFYRAVNALKASGEMDWEATEGLILKSLEPPGVVSIVPSAGQCPTSGTVSHERDCESHERDCVSHERDCESHERDCVSHERDNRSLKPLPDMGSSAPQIIQIYSDFKKTLSDSEREIFEKFVKEEWKKETTRPGQPGKEVVSVDRFLHKEEDFRNWHQRFLSSPAGKEAKRRAIASTDWTQHPDWEDWLAMMRQGVPRFVALGTCFDNKTRRAIADWADERGLIWGVES